MLGKKITHSYSQNSPWRNFINMIQGLELNFRSSLVNQTHKPKTMKKFPFLFIALASFLFYQCDILDQFTQFDIPYETQITIPGTPTTDLPLDIPTPNIETNIGDIFADQNTQADLIEEVSLKEMNMTITMPDSQTFEFLKSIEIFISADGLGEQRIAFLDSIPADVGQELVLEATGVNIKEYLLGTNYTLRISAPLNSLVAEDTDVRINLAFHVDAKIIV